MAPLTTTPHEVKETLSEILDTMYSLSNSDPFRRSMHKGASTAWGVACVEVSRMISLIEE